MIKKCILIDKIPAILWGEISPKLFIAVHGNMSSKNDVPIAILAEEALQLGYQVLSFDLPEHGDRINDETPCKVQNCVTDLEKVLSYAVNNAETISLFANSMGAYFSLLTYKNTKLKQCLFLSPLVDMASMINHMMTCFHITEERLEKEQEIETPIGHTLYWDYYQYVKQNPITKWDTPTSILYGKKDELCEYDTVFAFAKTYHCDFEIADNAKHYFHTDEDLSIYRNWLKRNILK